MKNNSRDFDRFLKTCKIYIHQIYIPRVDPNFSNLNLLQNQDAVLFTPFKLWRVSIIKVCKSNEMDGYIRHQFCYHTNES